MDINESNRQLVMDYREFKKNLAEEIWPEVGDSFEFTLIIVLVSIGIIFLIDNIATIICAFYA